MVLFKRKPKTTNLADELRKRARMEEELEYARKGKFPPSRGTTKGIIYQGQSAFSSFRDFATEFSKNQQPKREVKAVPRRKKRRKSRR